MIVREIDGDLKFRKQSRGGKGMEENPVAGWAGCRGADKAGSNL